MRAAPVRVEGGGDGGHKTHHPVWTNGTPAADCWHIKQKRVAAHSDTCSRHTSAPNQRLRIKWTREKDTRRQRKAETCVATGTQSATDPESTPRCNQSRRRETMPVAQRQRRVKTFSLASKKYEIKASEKRELGLFCTRRAVTGKSKWTTRFLMGNSAKTE